MSKGKKGRFSPSVLYPLALRSAKSESEDAFTATESRAEQTVTKRRLPPKSWFEKNGYHEFLSWCERCPEILGREFAFDPEPQGDAE